ncbi:hypothetical protein [Paenisporosarcina sp. NPDC076898]|uniref:hypothetical protein n=1 Tax=unclassified Paenisporosarcina TaxID=2642018 RepID=UPI003D006D07
MTNNKPKNKVIKSVSFNITNETDAKILKAIKRRNFSGYVKKLLLADILIRETEAILAQTNLAETTSVKESSSDRLAKLKEQNKKSRH